MDKIKKIQAFTLKALLGIFLSTFVACGGGGGGGGNAGGGNAGGGNNTGTLTAAFLHGDWFSFQGTIRGASTDHSASFNGNTGTYSYTRIDTGTTGASVTYQEIGTFRVLNGNVLEKTPTQNSSGQGNGQAVKGSVVIQASNAIKIGGLLWGRK